MRAESGKGPFLVPTCARSAARGGKPAGRCPACRPTVLPFPPRGGIPPAAKWRPSCPGAAVGRHTVCVVTGPRRRLTKADARAEEKQTPLLKKKQGSSESLAGQRASWLSSQLQPAHLHQGAGPCPIITSPPPTPSSLFFFLLQNAPPPLQAFTSAPPASSTVHARSRPRRCCEADVRLRSSSQGRVRTPVLSTSSASSLPISLVPASAVPAWAALPASFNLGPSMMTPLSELTMKRAGACGVGSRALAALVPPSRRLATRLRASPGHDSLLDLI